MSAVKEFDSRELYTQQALEGPPKVGMFIRASGWSRPRLVLAVDGDQTGSVVALHEPDSARADERGIRRMTSAEFNGRTWTHYPELSRLWAKAHGE